MSLFKPKAVEVPDPANDKWHADNIRSRVADLNTAIKNAKKVGLRSRLDIHVSVVGAGSVVTGHGDSVSVASIERTSSY